MLDYLIEEVVDRQPDDVSAFLLDTCVLDRLTGGLCDALTGRSDGQRMLERLERENLFVVPLDDARRWYRYHHLFADALRACLRADHPDRIGDLHAAASRWFAANGLLAEAVRQSAASGDPEHTADLIELTLADLRRRRQDQTLREWLAALPSSGDEQRLVLSLRDARPLHQGNARAVLSLSGPEGGLAEAEEDAARRAGFTPLSLGPRTLRADTAPLALLARLGAASE